MIVGSVAIGRGYTVARGGKRGREWLTLAPPLQRGPTHGVPNLHLNPSDWDS